MQPNSAEDRGYDRAPRAFESERPDAIFRDPYARRLAGGIVLLERVPV